MKKIIYILIFVQVFFIVHLQAQVKWISSGGPEGAFLQKITEDSSGNLIICSSGNIYRSTNDGLNWERIQTEGFTAANIYVIGNMYFAIANQDAEQNIKIYRSTDNMSTWKQIAQELMDKGIRSITRDSDGNLLACCIGSVYSSSDNGTAWQIKYTPANSEIIYNTEYEENSKGKKFIATTLGLYQSTDSGNNWYKVNIGQQGDFSGIEHLLINEGDIIFVTKPEGIYKSTDDGATWNQLAANLIQSNVSSIVNMDSSELIVSTWSGVFHSTDSGNTWATLNNTRLNSIVTKNNQIFGATNFGVIYTNNYFTNSTYRNHGIRELNTTSILAYKIGNEQIIFAGDNSGNIYRSSDEGNVWELSESLGGADVTSIIRGKSEGTIFAASIWGGIARSLDNGDTWEPLTNGIIDPDIRTMSIDSEGTLYAGSFSVISKSTDNGTTWQIVYQASQSVQCNSLVIATDNTIYAGTVSSGVLKSTNKGQNWTTVNSGVPLDISQLAIDNKENLYALSSTTGNLYKSTNRGTSWTLFTGEKSVQAFTVLSDENIIAEFGTTGIYQSKDGGVNWSEINSGLGNGNYALCFGINDDGFIYTGTLTGVYHSEFPVLGVDVEIVANQNGIKFYPNPVTNYLNAGLSSIVQYEIINQSGIKVQDGLFEGRIDVNELSPGIYYLKIGKQIYKFIKI